MTNEINRETVSLGIDFRPLPIDIGDGKVWQFDPDPSTEKLDNLISALRKVGQAGKAVQDEKDESNLQNTLGGLQKSLGEMLIDAKQRTEWGKKGYGLGALNALSNALIENTTGFSRKSSSKSGKG